ncbi:uncharacterized protein [Branchiostoma lanceolatum]|uniref:uncharacterized protein isoform X1 n=1 Tax=Branchiostoma lanceolatum TaxID=7740 RepID=UPI00345576F9
MSRQAPVSSSSTSAPSRVVAAPHYARLQHASGHIRPSIGYCVPGPQWQYVPNHPSVYPSVQPYAQPYVVQHPLAHPHHHPHPNPHAEPYVVRQPIFQPHYHPSVMPQGCVIAAPTYVKPTKAVHRPSQQSIQAAASSTTEVADNSGKQKTTASPKVDDDPAVIKILRREEAKPPQEAKTGDPVLPPQIIITDKEPLRLDDATKRTSTPSIISDDTGFDSASQKTSESGEDRNGDYLDIVHNLIEKIELDQGARKTQGSAEYDAEGVPISIDNSYSNIQFSPNKAPSLFGRAFRLSGRCKPKKKSPVKRTKGFGAPPKSTEASTKNPDSDAKPSEDDSWVEGGDNPVLAYQITEPTFDFDRARQEAERRAVEREMAENDEAAPYHGKRWRRKSRQPNRQPPMYKAWQAFKKPFKNRNQSQRGEGDGYYGNQNGNKNSSGFWQRGRTRRRHNTFGSQRHLADQLKLHQDGRVRGTYSVDPRGACVNLNLNISIPYKKRSTEADLDESRATIFDDDEAEPEAPPMMHENMPSAKRRSRRTTSEPRRRKNSYLRPNGCEGARQPGHDDWDEWVHAGGMVSGKWGVVPRRERLRRTSSRNDLWADDNPSAYDVACVGARQDALRKRQATGSCTRQRLGSNHA